MTKTNGVSARYSCLRIGLPLYRASQSRRKVSVYRQLAGNQTWICSSPLRIAWAASIDPMGIRLTRMFRPSSVAENSLTAHSSQLHSPYRTRCLSRRPCRAAGRAGASGAGAPNRDLRPPCLANAASLAIPEPSAEPAACWQSPEMEVPWKSWAVPDSGMSKRRRSGGRKRSNNRRNPRALPERPGRSNAANAAASSAVRVGRSFSSGDSLRSSSHASEAAV